MVHPYKLVLENLVDVTKRCHQIDFLGNRGLESATESVTEALIELTRCLRICRTLLWASQVPLREYPPRLGYSHSNPGHTIGNNMTGNGSGNLPSNGGNQNDERNPFQ